MSSVRLEKGLFLLGIAIMPLYLWSSGLPQLSHILVFLAWVVRILSGKLKFPAIDFFLILFVLFALMLLRQVLYFFSAYDFSALLPPVYLLYNILFMAMVFFLFKNDHEGKEARRVAASITVGSIIVTVWIFVGGFSLTSESGGLDRSIGPFNNPNQLGYYAICLGGFSTLFFQTRVIGIRYFVLLFFLGLLLSALSLSKASMISYIFYLFVFFRFRYIPYFVLIFLVAAVFVVTQDVERFHFVSRLSTLGESSDDNLEARGYGIIADMGLSFLWGLGEGFYTELAGNEIHSTFANILASYGFFALILVFGFQLILTFRASLNLGSVYSAVVLQIPFLLYGITHNGFRFSSIWLLFSLMAFINYTANRSVKTSLCRNG